MHGGLENAYILSESVQNGQKPQLTAFLVFSVAVTHGILVVELVGKCLTTMPEPFEDFYCACKGPWGHARPHNNLDLVVGIVFRSSCQRLFAPSHESPAIGVLVCDSESLRHY